jgi:hypothetical protein
MTKKFDAKITREVDPRGEATEHILEYDILTNSKHQLPHTPIEEVIAQTVMFVDEVKANTKLDVMAGATSWKS